MLSCFSITLKLIASWEVVEYVTVTLISVVVVVSWAGSSMMLIDVLMGVFVGASDGCRDGDCVGRVEVGSPVG